MTIGITDAIRSKAFDVAKQLAKVEGFTSEMAGQLEAGEKLKRGPVHLLLNIEVAVNTGTLPKDFWESLPVPGTEAVNEDGTKNNLYDKYMMEVEGTNRKQPASFYGHLFDALDVMNIMRPGKKPIHECLTGLRLANSKDKASEAPEEYQTMNPSDRKSEISRFESLRTAGRRQLRKCMALHFQVKAVRDYGMKVNFKMKKDADGKTVPSDTTVPITVQDPDNAGNFEVYNVDEFLNLKPGDAEKAGADFQALKVSGQKKRASGTPTGDQKWTTSNMEARFNLLATEIVSKEGSTFRAAVMNKLNSDDEFVQTMGKVIPWFIELWEGGLDKKFYALSKAQLAAEGKAA